MEYVVTRKSNLLTTFFSSSTDPFDRISKYRGSYCINPHLKNAIFDSINKNYTIKTLSIKGGEYIDYYNQEQFFSFYSRHVLVYDKLDDLLYIEEVHDGEPNLVFDGSSLILYEKIGGNKVRMIIPALSGIKNKKNSYSYDPLPNGEYKVNRPYKRKDVKGMIRDGVGYSMDVIPKFSSINGDKMKRTELRIHPDGNNPGSAGCIALSTDKEDLNTFYLKMHLYIKQYGSVDLSVYDKSNPNVMYNRHLGKKSIGE